MHLLDVDTFYRMAEHLYRFIHQTTIEDSSKKVMILSVALYGWEDGQNTREEYHTLRTFQNNLLWRLFGLKREDIIGKQRKLKELKYY